MQDECHIYTVTGVPQVCCYTETAGRGNQYNVSLGCFVAVAGNVETATKLCTEERLCQTARLCQANCAAALHSTVDYTQHGLLS